jgi:hypothetical protein
MKARIKKTGEIINIASYATITLDVCDSWGNPIEMKPEEIELIQDKTDDFDWQSFRTEAVKDILCAIIQSGYYGEDRIAHQSELAVGYANELVKQLKEK